MHLCLLSPNQIRVNPCLSTLDYKLSTERFAQSKINLYLCEQNQRYNFMSNLIHIDKDYKQWIQSLSQRFRQSQIKAAVHVNQEMLRFYWELGGEIVALNVEERWG